MIRPSANIIRILKNKIIKTNDVLNEIKKKKGDIRLVI
jgi:hypothetical protein